MLQKGQSWIFDPSPVIIGSAAVGGVFEGQGPLMEDFDFLFEDNWAGCQSFEQAESCFVDRACHLALEKAAVWPEDINLFLAGDLINQITPSSFAAANLSLPYLGVFSACATALEGLALAAIIISGGASQYILTASSSHNKGAERQFRYPNEYGCQKCQTCQHTATAAGAAVLATQGQGIKIKSATIGKVANWGIDNPQNMGAAMAPAAYQTIKAHLEDLSLDADYYDLIITGDLGKIGREIAYDLLKDDKIEIKKEHFLDCGLLLYDESQNVFAGGSGAGCVASVLYGHLCHKLLQGDWRRILLVATGALLSPNTTKQGDTIPAIAHAIALEGDGH